MHRGKNEYPLINRGTHHKATNIPNETLGFMYPVIKKTGRKPETDRYTRAFLNIRASSTLAYSYKQ